LETEERYLVVVNPVGRGGYAQRQGVWLLNKLRRMGIEHEALFTEKAGHAQELIATWSEPVDVIVAVGGDGTINEVINGIMSSGQRARKLAVFPSGTADDFARNMKIPRDREEALKVILGEYERKIDLMRVNERFAAVTVGMGLDAEIAHRSYGSKRMRLLAYWYHGLGMLFKPLPRFRLSIDVGEEHLDGEYMLVVAGNAGSYGRYLKMMPGASMDDGELDMATFFPMNKLKTLFFFVLVTVGKHTWTRDFNQYSGGDITIECLDGVYAQFDGEVVVFPGGERLEMKVEPLAISVRVPRKHAGA